MSQSSPEHRRAYCAENKERIADRKRAYYQAHKEAISAKLAEYRAANRGILSEKSRTYYAANKERVNERGRDYYYAHKGQDAERCHAYYLAHRDEKSRYHRGWRTSERGKVIVRANSQRRRAWKLGALGVDYTTTKMIKGRCEMWGNRCYICGGPMGAVDHVKPLSRGGPHLPCNLRPICKTCNAVKKDKWPYGLALDAVRKWMASR
jgi:5-methylcytosine-specific restriction endonuclease McrA